jgi:cell division protein FtsI (penicillin-binding protein 3)
MGTTKLALSVPKDFLLDRFFDAGFGSKTGTDLIGESSGIMHDRQRWSEFELATLSWGYGLALTPLQLARFYATLANDGVKNELSIIKGIEKDPGERVYSSENTKAVVNMLESVVDEHVPNALVSGYRVGGKTGTSIKAVAGGYGNDYVGLFAGVAPISNPELAVVVVINEPGGDLYYGGEVAAPVFSRVMKGALQILNINPDKNSMQTSLSQKKAIEEDNDA